MSCSHPFTSLDWNIMKLRVHVALALLVPMVLALVVAGGIVAVYLSIYYADSVQTASDDMKTQQASVLGKVSSLLSDLGSSALMGKLNHLLLSEELMRSQKESDLKSGWNEDNNCVNAWRFGAWTKGEVPLKTIPGLNSTTNSSYYYAMWVGWRATTIEELNSTSRANVRLAASFDYLSQSILRLGTANEVYYAFESDGLLYFLPTMFTMWSYDPAAMGLTADKCHRTMGEDKYDPRCRPYYIETVENGVTRRITVASPYLFADKNTIGLTGCAPLWIGGALQYMHCLDFDLLELQRWMETVKIGSAGYSYLVTPKGRPYIHPKLDTSWTSDPPSLEELEFSRDVTYPNVSALRADYEANIQDSSVLEEIAYFDSTIMPQLKSGVQNITSYSRLGETFIVGISPLSLRFSVQDRSQYLSVAVAMEVTAFTSLYNTLVRSGDDLIEVVGIVLGVVLVGLLILGVVAVLVLSSFVVRQFNGVIQHINAILGQDYRHYIEKPEVVPAELKDMYQLLLYMKHISHYNLNQDLEMHELLAVLHDLHDLKEVSEFLTCLKTVVERLIHEKNYAESMEIGLLVGSVFDDLSDITKLQKSPKALGVFARVLDLLALSAMQLASSLTMSIAIQRIKAVIWKIPEEVKPTVQTQIHYINWLLNEGVDASNPQFHDYVSYLRRIRKDMERHSPASLNLVVFTTEYSSCLKGNAIEFVLSLACETVRCLRSVEDMFGFVTYNDSTVQAGLQTGALNRLAYTQAIERFNNPCGEADFWEGLIGGLDEIEKHSTHEEIFQGKDVVSTDLLIVVTTGKAKEVHEEAARERLRKYQGRLAVLCLQSHVTAQGCSRIRGMLQQVQETSLWIRDIQPPFDENEAQNIITEMWEWSEHQNNLRTMLSSNKGMIEYP